jgi:hypothetical protein
MGKKRKTKQQKIILQLKRQLNQNRPISAPISTELPISQEEVFRQPQAQVQEVGPSKISDVSSYSGNLKLIKKDLLKTLLLTLAVISFEVVLYLKLR